jgi:hypothetical protein
VDILSTLPNYRVTLNDPPANRLLNYDVMPGTSMATPLVSGTAALVWTARPELTAAQVRERIQAVALDLGAPGRDPLFGFGRVNAFAAVNPTPPQPPQPTPPTTPPWAQPTVRGFLDEWVRQADRCLKRKFPRAYVDRYGRGCGDFGSTFVHCNQTPGPPFWDSYRYLWENDVGQQLYPYRVRDYVTRRLGGQSFSDLATCR